jgi:hypothetical protein
VSLPSGVGVYQVIRPANLTEEEKAILHRAGQERVVERLIALMSKGKIAASGAQRFYVAFTRSTRTEVIQ